MLTLYSKPNCPACEAMKKVLASDGIAFDVVDVSQCETARQMLISKGHRSVPVLYRDGVRISDISTLLKDI